MDKGFDWIRLTIAVVLGAALTALIVIARIEWWYLTPYKTLRIIAIPVLWLCFSFLIWRSINSGRGDSDL